MGRARGVPRHRSVAHGPLPGHGSGPKGRPVPPAEPPRPATHGPLPEPACIRCMHRFGTWGRHGPRAMVAAGPWPGVQSLHASRRVQAGSRGSAAAPGTSFGGRFPVGHAWGDYGGRQRTGWAAVAGTGGSARGWAAAPGRRRGSGPAAASRRSASPGRPFLRLEATRGTFSDADGRGRPAGPAGRDSSAGRARD